MSQPVTMTVTRPRVGIVVFTVTARAGRLLLLGVLLFILGCRFVF
jgi:hypothetical protein